MRQTIGLLALLLAACSSPPEPKLSLPPITLTGTLTRANHQTYVELPFTVPAGATQIAVDFAYTGKENRAVIDIGLRDPKGQRGWSGGNKSAFVISATHATPSYRAGPIEPGVWTLLLGLPNLREGQTADYTATISFDAHEDSSRSAPVPDWSLTTPLNASPGWYRGDFHAHTAHSDGSCDVAGKRAPCPPEETFAAARDAGLDFVAITDHNTITQLTDIKRDQARYPKTLLIPGTEVTTFFGHANVIGNTDFVDFQLGSPRLPTLSKLFDEAAAQGAIVSINHPGLPSGEICMGCGWTAKDTDWSRVTAMEVINGGTLRTGGAEAGTQGIKLWDSLLKQGYRITAIGGSDNHDATDRTGAKQSPVGVPATVVYASDLSVRGIVEGVRKGQVFVDVAGLPNARLHMQAFHAGHEAFMGGEILQTNDAGPIMDVLVRGLPADAKLVFVTHNVAATEPRPLPPMPRYPGYTPLHFGGKLMPGADRGYIRPEIRDANGKLLLLGNPIYFVRATAG